MPTLAATTTYNRNGPRKAVNLSLNEDLVLRAKGLTQNLSATVEDLLSQYINNEQARRQAEDGRLEQVITALNARHLRDGSLSDEFSSL
jgi:antitoxin CcdA